MKQKFVIRGYDSNGSKGFYEGDGLYTSNVFNATHFDHYESAQGFINLVLHTWGCNEIFSIEKIFVP